MKHSNKSSLGFTLAELLIVVAIVAVLTAVAIPVFAGQLEKSREATDTANIRSQYAEVMAKANETGKSVNEDGSEFAKIELKQKDGYWQNNGMESSLKSIATMEGDGPFPGGTAWVSYTQSTGAVIHFSGGTSSTTPVVTEPTPEPTSGMTPEQANTQNNDTGKAIGNVIIEEMDRASLDSSANVTLKVNPDGTYSIDTKHCGTLTAESLATALENKGLITGNKIDFAGEDTVFINGYQVKITSSSGSRKIHISKI